MPERRALRRLAPLVLAALALAATTPAGAFGDAALVKGFVVTVFGAEVPDEANGPASRYVKKFTGPVRYHLVSTGGIDRRRTVRAFIGQLGRTVGNLSFEETRTIEEAQMVVYLVDRVDYVATIRATVWEGVDAPFLEMNACSAVIAARSSGIERAFVYLVADVSRSVFTHCMVEEISQSLGPANDSAQLPDSIFNDDSRLNEFGLFDWYILNMLYDRRIRPGMSEGEVLPLLPAAIADARRRLPHALARQQAAIRARVTSVAPLP